MEDKSNSGTKKVQGNNLENDEGDGPLFEGPHLSDAISESSDLNVSLDNNFLHFSLPNHPCNFKSLEKLNSLKADTNLFKTDSEKKIKRSFYALNKSLSKISSLFLDKESQLSANLLRKNTIDLLHSELYSWHTLLRHLVSMPSLSNFNICQVLCHEKGTTNVNSYSFGTDKQLIESKTSIDSFNKVFNQIKKAKNKQFSQTNLTIPEFNFVGSFLASTHQLKTHNILFLLSENSFFPIADHIIEEVNRITPQFKAVLGNVITKDLSDSKVSNLLRVFEVLPIPVSIQSQFGSAVYQNESFKSFYKQESQETSNMFEAPLNDGFKLTMVLNSDLTKSDVQHYQRVSLLGELLNTLQHELSNPLFGIQLATEFLNLQHCDDSVRESLGEVSEYCKRCQDIIRDFKFIYQGGDQILEVSLTKIIKETLTLSKSASRGISKKVIFENSEELDKINTNPTWLSQIIFNLIINSSQAIHGLNQLKEGDGVIEIELNQKDESHIEICISDNGPGISSDKASSVFDPFYTTKEKGTGLGLAICQNLASKLGGSMTYKNSKLDGASFSLLLPINEIP